MRHRLATPEDSGALAELNHQLIQDEGHRNSMTIPELAERMRGWFAADYRASIFEDDSGILAYALYREEKEYVYLRQLFVQRHKRRAGIGRQCMKILFTEIWPQDKRITVEVLTQNSTAITFWREVGFTDYSLSLEIYPDLKSRFKGVVHNQ
ncbi:MAG: GNAT family N-acetyltransferase [Methylacidiphilales bacterium]|nr:GNAT family N-acetyltransferase [Candidatus Methylacidiphilales bacterium]